MKKVLFLYTELAGYVVSCMKAAAQSGLEIHVVRWPVKSEAPFNFGPDLPITLYDRMSLNRGDILTLAADLAPKAILCSGWVDKDYLAVCRHFAPQTSTVLLLDNPWQGSLRQRLAVIYARFFLKRSFNHAWVPGLAQEEFVRRLGIPIGHIKRGFYCADLPLFDQVWQLRKTQTELHKVLLYVGRYADFKGIRDMWDAFIHINSEKPHGWTLKCIGTGDLWDERPYHPAVEHVGFVQPSDMHVHLASADVFILPSHREPWGVVVHEMAACGMPLLCSDAVGANEAFLEEGKNGFTFRSGDRESLIEALQKMISLTPEPYRQMGEKSRALAARINQEQWASTLHELTD